MKDFVIEKSTSEESRLVDDGIYKYNLLNVPFTQEPAFIPINRVIKGLNGEVLAGINSELYCWNCLYVSILWVSDQCRKGGNSSCKIS